jgi:hypothetical protein
MVILVHIVLGLFVVGFFLKRAQGVPPKGSTHVC